MISRAYKQSVLLGIGIDGKSHILGKGPELGIEAQKQLLRNMAANGGVAKIGEDEVKFASAALVGGGRYRKRRAFHSAEVNKAHSAEAIEDAKARAVSMGKEIKKMDARIAKARKDGDTIAADNLTATVRQKRDELVRLQDKADRVSGKTKAAADKKKADKKKADKK